MNIYDEKEIRIYDIVINIEKKIEYKSDDCLKSIGNILNYIENQKDKIKIEAKCNKEENNYIIWIESKNYENLYLKWKSYEGKSTSLTIKEKEEEFNKLSDKEKKY